MSMYLCRDGLGPSSQQSLFMEGDGGHWELVVCPCVSCPVTGVGTASGRAQGEVTTYLPSPQPVHRVALAPVVPTCVHVDKGRPVTLCQGFASVLLGRLESIVSMVSIGGWAHAPFTDVSLS